MRRAVTMFGATLLSVVVLGACSSGDMPVGEWGEGPMHRTNQDVLAALTKISDSTTKGQVGQDGCADIAAAADSAKKDPKPADAALAAAWSDYLDAVADVGVVCAENDAAAAPDAFRAITDRLDDVKTALAAVPTSD